MSSSYGLARSLGHFRPENAENKRLLRETTFVAAEHEEVLAFQKALEKPWNKEWELQQALVHQVKLRTLAMSTEAVLGWLKKIPNLYHLEWGYIT